MGYRKARVMLHSRQESLNLSPAGRGVYRRRQTYEVTRLPVLMEEAILCRAIGSACAYRGLRQPIICSREERSRPAIGSNTGGEGERCFFQCQ